MAPTRPRPTQSMPGHRAGAEGDPQGAGHATALGGGGGGAHVAPHGDAHADEPGQPGERGAEEEADDAVDAVLGEREGQDLLAVRYGTRGPVFTTWVAVKKIRMASGTTMMAMVRNWRRQERLGALLDGLGDLLHLRRALVEGQHVAGQQQAGGDADDAGNQADVEPRLVRPAEVEGLVATLSCEEIDHSRCALSVPVSPTGRGGRLVPAVRQRSAPRRSMSRSRTEGAPGRSHPTPGRGGR